MSLLNRSDANRARSMDIVGIQSDAYDVRSSQILGTDNLDSSDDDVL